jgi:hypothetical protein
MHQRERDETSSKAGLHGFSLELASREHIKQVAMPSGPGDRLLIQGYLGELEKITFTEGVLLEIRGSHGELSIDLLEEELEAFLATRCSKTDGTEAQQGPD